MVQLIFQKFSRFIAAGLLIIVTDVINTVMSEAYIPVIHSIPDGDALIVHIITQYPIDNPRSCKLCKRGLNDTYLVETDTDKYILRVYRRNWRSQEEINFELEILAFLHEKNQPVAYPIARKDGIYTTEVIAPEGRRYIAIFSYAPGTTNKNLNTAQSYNLGVAKRKYSWHNR